MATYNYYSTPYICPESPESNRPTAGWYKGNVFIVFDYKNPATNKPYTPTELNAIQPGVVGPVYVQPAKPASAASMWILGIIILIIAAGVVWFVVK